MTGRRLAAAIVTLGALGTSGMFTASPAAAQRMPGQSNGSLIRALDLEQRGRNAEAVAAFRDALGSSDMLAALLGLERVYAAMSQSDSLIPIADSLARAHPSETMVQIVRLRVLRYARRPAAATAAFAEWVKKAPSQITPYREYARILLETGDLATADSVIEAAQRLPGADRALAAERARRRGERPAPRSRGGLRVRRGDRGRA